MTSPSRTFCEEMPSRMTAPIPAVLMNSLSTLPRGTTFVSPQTIFAPLFSSSEAMLSTMRSSSSKESPSSIMNAALR